MRILWVKAGKILPIDTGGRIRSYNIMRHLARRHALTFVSYYRGQRDRVYEDEISRQLPAATTLHDPTPEGNLAAQVVDYLWHLPSAVPYAVTKFTCRPVRDTIEKWLGERRFDVAICDFLSASRNFSSHSPIPVVLFQHNVESELWSRLAREERNWIRKVGYLVESAKMSRYERLTLRRFDHVIAVSQRDKEHMRAMLAADRITVVPTGVDLEKFRTVQQPSAPAPRVVFTGSMDWEPNIDGVEYFCREIWPQVRAEIPQAQFQIVGRSPHPRVQRLACDGVEVTGTVPSIVDHVKQAAVFVVPLRVGGGTRLKIYEAMAMGKAVVSTTIGAEGLDVHHGRDVLLADDSSEFAPFVIRLLTDADFRNRIGRAAAETAARYDWSAVAARFEQVLQQVTGARGPEPPQTPCKSL